MENIDVSIVMGSDSDLKIMKSAADFLDELGISYETRVISVHRTPERVAEYVKELKEKDVKVVIGGAGGAAHLPGVIAAQLPIPVIGVPIITKTLNGVDSLYSIVQMPSGIPVATVAINGAKNADILAATILGVSQDETKEKVSEYKESMKEKVLVKDRKLQKLGIDKYMDQM